MEEPRRVFELSDPVALRALAHPLRMKLVGLLRTKGPLTATQAAELVGESTGSTSFHLRQLAKYGLVEEAGGGHGRQKPWRATAQFTSWPSAAAAPEAAVAITAMNSSVAQVYTNLLAQWLRTSADEPPEWQEAAGMGDTIVYVTPDELAEFTRGVQVLLAGLQERVAHPELRPPGARAVDIITLALPYDPPGRG
ncbi:MAG TPA: helix-turn-helix domain-containing protein [Pseudonocardiaceae bacterium]|nr:helix-turn-helix domain-containing protein [Pseudonocardiaceae bacterium]